MDNPPNSSGSPIRAVLVIVCKYVQTLLLRFLLVSPVIQFEQINERVFEEQGANNAYTEGFQHQPERIKDLWSMEKEVSSNSSFQHRQETYA